MCSEGGDRKPVAPTGKRRRLWEIDNRLHCSIVGTCLSLGDLRRLERQLEIEPLQGASDFHIHGNFVVWAGEDGPVARRMHRLLDRRYAKTIRRFAAANAEDLEVLWATSLREGDIPGPYWSVLTHPAAAEMLTMRAFGEVHMLSHLVGAANRADIRRLMILEGERDGLAELLAVTRRRLVERDRDHRRLLGQQAAEVRGLGNRLSAKALLEQRLQQMLARGQAREATGGHVKMRAALAEAQAALRQSEQMVADRRQRIADLVDDIHRLRQSNADHEQACRDIAAECEAMESLLRAQPAIGYETPHADGEQTGNNAVDVMAHDAQCIDLAGRRIIYIGGRQGADPHCQSLVERCGGLFLHHDANVDARGDQLDTLLRHDDAVFCPINCISHETCIDAKRVCRKRSMTFVPLRSDNLSSFIQGLRVLSKSVEQLPV